MRKAIAIAAIALTGCGQAAIVSQVPEQAQVEVERPQTTVIENAYSREFEATYGIEIEVLANLTRLAARELEGTEPDTPVSIEFVDVALASRPGLNGYHINGIVTIRHDGPKVLETVMHEVAHALTPHNPTGEWIYDDHSQLHHDVLEAAMQRYAESLINWG